MIARRQRAAHASRARAHDRRRLPEHAAQALAARGIIDNVRGYPIVGDYSQPNPQARILEALARGEIDVAIVWGPFAGYFAKHLDTPLTIVPVTPAGDASGELFAFDIAMGLRRSDTALARTLDTLLVRERPAIQKILSDYGVPLAAGQAGDGPIHGE